MSTRRAGGDGPAALKDFDPEESSPRWPYPVVEMLRGKRTLDETVEAATDNGKPDPGKLCELYLFAGKKCCSTANANRRGPAFARAWTPA